MRTSAHLANLKNHIILNSTFSDSIGLLNGKASTVLFLSSQSDSHLRYNSSISIINGIIGQINNYSPLGFGEGISGIGVLVEYLATKQIIQNTSEILKDPEPNILNLIYGARLLNISIYDGISGIGFYLLARYSSAHASDDFQKLRIRECIIASIDQLNYRLLNYSSDQIYSIWTGLAGAALFLNKATDLHFNEPKNRILLDEIFIQIYQNLLKSSDFNWTHLESYFALLMCKNVDQSNKILLLNLFENYIKRAKYEIDQMNFYDATMFALYLSLLGDKYILRDASMLSCKIVDYILKILEKNPIGKIFPYNFNDKCVPMGVFRGICGTALPLLSIENKTYDWMKIIGLDVI
jgi:hypothetical protein